jgi:hypothetical protein
MVSAGDGRVAVYWDFENLYSALGLDTTKSAIPAIVTLASTFGTTIINRAYGNWARYGQFQRVLHESAIDLVQMFPVASAKNGADIRMAADAIADRFLHSDLTHVMIVSTDSDFTGLAKRLRELGTTVIGVGGKATTSAWRHACHDFRYFDDVLRAPQAPASANELAAVRALLFRAADQLLTGEGQESPRQGLLFSVMKRLDPTFTQARFGYKTFSEFVTAIGAGRIENFRDGPGDFLIRYATDDGKSPTSTPLGTVEPQSAPSEVPAATDVVHTEQRAGGDKAGPDVAPDPSLALADRYRSLIMVSNTNMPEPAALRYALDEFDRLPDEGDSESLKREMAHFFALGGFDKPEAAASGCCHLMKVANVYRPLDTNNKRHFTLAVENEVDAHDLITDFAANMLIRHVAGAVDPTALVAAVFGPDLDGEREQLLEALEGRDPGGAAHRARAAWKRSGLLLIGAKDLSRLNDALASGRLNGSYAPVTDADAHIVEVLSVQPADAGRLRNLLYRCAGSTEPLVLTTNAAGTPLFAGLGRLLATWPEVKNDWDQAAIELARLCALDPDGEDAQALAQAGSQLLRADAS